MIHTKIYLMPTGCPRHIIVLQYIIFALNTMYSFHSFITGYYIFTEASDISPGARAEISTPVLGGCGPYKLRFSHHMFGHHIGELIVREVRPSGTEQVWSKQSSDESK